MDITASRLPPKGTGAVSDANDPARIDPPDGAFVRPSYTRSARKPTVADSRHGGGRCWWDSRSRSSGTTVVVPDSAPTAAEECRSGQRRRPGSLAPDHPRGAAPAASEDRPALRIDTAHVATVDRRSWANPEEVDVSQIGHVVDSGSPTAPPYTVGTRSGLTSGRPRNGLRGLQMDLPVPPLAPSVARYSRRRTTPPIKAAAATAPAATTASFAIERARSAASWVAAPPFPLPQRRVSHDRALPGPRPGPPRPSRFDRCACQSRATS
jgi:hypothetical protein